MSDLEKMAEVHGDRCAELPVCPACRAQDLQAKDKGARAAQREEDARTLEWMASKRASKAARAVLFAAAEELRRGGKEWRQTG